MHALSGASASCLSTLLLYPLENMKTRKLIEQKKEHDMVRITTLKNRLNAISKQCPQVQEGLKRLRAKVKAKRSTKDHK